MIVAGMLTAGAAIAADELPKSADRIPTDRGEVAIHPLNHATFAMQWNDVTIYVDPVGGADRFRGLPKPDLILVTDIHGDHLNVETIEAVRSDATIIVAPSAVIERFPEELNKRATKLANGEKTEKLGIRIEAVPMYNLTEERLRFHAKGRGNGYVLTVGGRRLYISGDTEDIPEMRKLKNIDVAFVCMNLPYTMTVQQAAGAVREFKPKIVYPYHHRGSDVEEFRRLVRQVDGIDVRLREWYPM